MTPQVMTLSLRKVTLAVNLVILKEFILLHALLETNVQTMILMKIVSMEQTYAAILTVQIIIWFAQIMVNRLLTLITT